MSNANIRATGPLASDVIRVNAAPALTLWAAVVAERLGHPPDAALSLAGVVAGTSPPAGPAGRGPSILLFGRQVPVTAAADGSLHAADPDGLPADPAPLRHYIERAFGAHLPEARAAMEACAASLPAEEVNRHGLRLFDAFRPDPAAVPRGRASLSLARIRAAAEPGDAPAP